MMTTVMNLRWLLLDIIELLMCGRIIDMRAKEFLIEYTDTDVKVRNRKPNYDYDSLYGRKETSDDRDTFGGGWYSSGFTNPKDPHEFVKKTYFTSLLDVDAYYAYVTEINKLKKQGYHNRFFPQVYTIDIVKDPKGNQRPRYRIEKLQQGDNLSVEALLGMYENLFYNDYDRDLRKSSNPQRDIWSDIAYQCNKAIEQDYWDNIEDSDLLEALLVIKRIQDKNKRWIPDLHANNIRIRGSNVGPQLVLMDPISDDGISIPSKHDIHNPLLEYDRNKTAKNYGAAIYKKMLGDRTVQRIYGDDPIQQINSEELLGFALDRFQEADPTPNKQYVQWIARTYANDASTKLEDVLDGYLFDYLTKFYKLVQRNKIPSPRNDINRYSNFGDFMSVMDEYPDPEAQQLKDKGKAFTLFDDENWRVIVPQDQTASCYYGQGTRWCTAATKGNNMFNYYSDIAPILIAIPKQPEYPGEKYQFHFGISLDDHPVKSDSDIKDIADQYNISPYSDDGYTDYLPLEYGQIMDMRDDPVALNQIKIRMGDSWDDMLNAYLSKFPDRQWQLYMNLDHSAENDY